MGFIHDSLHIGKQKLMLTLRTLDLLRLLPNTFINRKILMPRLRVLLLTFFLTWVSQFTFLVDDDLAMLHIFQHNIGCFCFVFSRSDVTSFDNKCISAFILTKYTQLEACEHCDLSYLIEIFILTLGMYLDFTCILFENRADTI